MKSLIAGLEKSGVTLVRNCAVTKIYTSGQKPISLETEKGTFDVDHFHDLIHIKNFMRLLL